MAADSPKALTMSRMCDFSMTIGTSRWTTDETRLAAHRGCQLSCTIVPLSCTPAANSWTNCLAPYGAMLSASFAYCGMARLSCAEQPM